VGLALVPSSLMLSATTYLTTDIAPIPLLWVVPLALYLLTFILAFSGMLWVAPRRVGRLLPMVVLALTVLLLTEATEPVWLLVLMHLGGLFMVALYCHAELAADRPDPRFLTGFYFWLSLGGVLGGSFNALVAPVLFPGIAEYPLILVLACLLMATRPGAPAPARSDLWWPLGLGLVTLAVVLVVQKAGVPAGTLSVALMFAAPAVVCYTFMERPLRFGLGIGALFLAGLAYDGVHGRPEYRTRSFFGTHKVALDPSRQYRRLIHGNTIHGQQSLDPSRRRQPQAYFHRNGPVGSLFRRLEELGETPRNVAVVGLGSGTLAAYAQPGQHWTFYEIDPTVIWIARDSGYFTYLEDAAETLGRPVEIVEGDARLQMAEGADGGRKYDLLIIDAFSSDALPVHLFTKQALQVYRQRLTPRGIIAFHVSNRYLSMEKVLAGLAEDAGLLCYGRVVRVDRKDQEATGQFSSQWVVLGPRTSAVAELPRTGGWERLRPDPGQPLWRDEHTHILGLMHWGLGREGD
jgi:hypothetical protein